MKCTLNIRETLIKPINFTSPHYGVSRKDENKDFSEIDVDAECGFTLLELLVVMAIIGLLAAYVGPRYFSQVGKSEIKIAQAQIDSLEKALHQYRLDVGTYPTTEQGLNALITAPGNESRWNGPYLSKKLPEDPWGRSYQYKYPGTQSDFDLFSFGKDGQSGGSGEDADITNW